MEPQLFFLVEHYESRDESTVEQRWEIMGGAESGAALAS